MSRAPYVSGHCASGFHAQCLGVYRYGTPQRELRCKCKACGDHGNGTS